MAQDRPPKYEQIESYSRRGSVSSLSSRPSSPSGSPPPTTPRRHPVFQPITEDSPLLSPTRPEDAERLLAQEAIPADQLTCDDGAHEASKSTWYLFLLTLSIGGLQIAWAVEISNGSPYLLSLGMDKSLLAFVWIAGPLSGTLVQPYIGIRSDNCRMPWGKRRPFMVAGALATILSLLALAWTREIVGGFLGLFGADADSKGVRVSSIVFAIVFVYILDFAINTVQAGIRAFIVDNAPAHQQEDANAWAGRITGVGNVLGYLSGYVNLPKIFPVFGNTQFKVLCVIAAFALGGTVLVSCLSIDELDPGAEGEPETANPGVLDFFRQVFASLQRLPPQIRAVCEVQFFNWIAWFPFLFYITTYIGQLYVNPIFAANPHMSDAEVDAAWEDATRVATLALLIFAITSFASNVFLPLVVVPTYRAPTPPNPNTNPAPYHSSQHHTRHSSMPGTPGTPSGLGASMTSYFPSSPSPSLESHSRLARLLSLLQIPWLTLRRAWMLAHLLFALCMACTFFITSTTGATILVAVIGVSWALTLWAPFALISAEIKRAPLAGRPGTDGLADKVTDQAGVILGLHNVAVAAPQIVATLVSSAIFHLAQKPRGTPGDESVGWVLRFGGVAALVAAYMTVRVKEEGGKGKEEGGEGV